MWSWVKKLLGHQTPTHRVVHSRRPKLVFTAACIEAIHDCLKPELRKQHEGIAYLLGLTNGTTTLVVAAMRPLAVTTRGSFDVGSPAMAVIVRTAANLGLQVVGQIHTHPGDAYHSHGDVVGARIAYSGFASIVLPDYGRHLPALTGAAAYMFRNGQGFVALDHGEIIIAPGRAE